MIEPLDNNEKHPHWQALINIAYARWQEGGDLHDYETFVQSLDDISERAVALKNLNYQVCNGGFTQWHGNGYSGDAETITETLENFIDTPAGERVRRLVNEAWEENIDYFENIKRQFDRACRSGDNWQLSDFQNTFIDMCDEKMNDELSMLDSKYYEANEALLDDIEAWLSTTPEGKAALERVKLLSPAAASQV